MIKKIRKKIYEQFKGEIILLIEYPSTSFGNELDSAAYLRIKEHILKNNKFQKGVFL